MIQVTVQEILYATGGTLLSGQKDAPVTCVTTDSRKVEKGALFVAILGEKVDGHDYVESAFSLGAAAALVEKQIEADGTVVLVDSTIQAMGALAKYIMEKISVPTVAITGSVGKTTTRDMTHAVLSQKMQTLKNENNFNNEIGVPLTVFRAEDVTRAAVIEMGMDNFGEIDRLAQIAPPDAAIVTNIGMSHIERLGSQENIYKAKSEMFSHVKPGGVVILNGDDAILMAHKEEIAHKVITVGVKNREADLTAHNISANAFSVSFTFSGMGKTGKVTLPVPGEHNVLDALLSIAAGIYFDVPVDKIIHALRHFSLEKMRMDVKKCQTVTVISDCYNAAPDSVRAALSVLSCYPDRKVAILGDIAALGAFSYDAHLSLGTDVVRAGVDLLITVGENARFIAEGAFLNGLDSANIISVDDAKELFTKLAFAIHANDVILVKASRVMGFERVTEYLENNF